MDSMRLGSRAAITLAMFAVAAIAQAALPELEPAQILRPSDEDVHPDPNQEPLETRFGTDVAIQEGSAAVGLPGANDGGGSVAIFSRDASGAWIRRATLTPQDSSAGARFGNKISLSGRHAVVAATNAIYVFEGAGDNWQERQKLALSGTVSDVALAGRLVIVGTGDYGENGAQVFRLGRDGRLHAVAQLMPSDVQAADRFGAAVAISGATVAITAPGYNSGEGAAYVFTCNEFGCLQRQKLLATDGGQYARFGESLAVLGNTLVVGAPSADPVDGNPEEPTGEDNYNAQGAAYVFVRSAGTWVETQKLRVTPDEYDWYYNLGLSVALSADSIVIGAPYGLTRVVPGKLFIYKRMGTLYVATHAHTGAAGLGHSTAISGSTVLSGAPLEYWDQGEAGLYTLP